jgi:hypothetical protein
MSQTNNIFNRNDFPFRIRVTKDITDLSGMTIEVPSGSMYEWARLGSWDGGGEVGWINYYETVKLVGEKKSYYVFRAADVEILSVEV